MRITALVAGLALISNAALGSDVLGTWKSEVNDEGNYVHVQMAPCSSDAKLICGTIVKAENVDPSKGDPKRQAEIMGKVMINDMAADGANAWDDGTIWAPDDDETYSSNMELKGNVLTVSGCVLGGLICRGQDWTRVE